ncbi:hypothetical protein [Streptomyces sp. A5-4]|uniref:hypothetical protein n=1 Tax=Streptomyces sp. A5-4 TaxID=3384771 RepID=UPI003DA9345F
MISALAGFVLIIYEAVRGTDYPRWVYPVAVTLMLGLLWAAWPSRESAESGRRNRGTAEQATDRRPPVLSRTNVQVIIVSVVLSWFATRNALTVYEASGHLGPQDAPDILLAGAALSALLTAISLAVSRVLRADGAQRRAWGEGAQAEQEGRAAEIRAEFEGRAAQVKAEHEGRAAEAKAEHEGRAAVIMAEAAHRRADAEYLRAEKGIDPLPVQGSEFSVPPAIGPAPGANGVSGAPTPDLPPGSADGTP